MDWSGIAALVVALSGLGATASGIVLAFRHDASQGRFQVDAQSNNETSKSLPPNSPKPGESVATGMDDVCIS